MRLSSISFGTCLDGLFVDVVHETEKPDGYICNHNEYVSFKITHDFASLEFRLTEPGIKQPIIMLERAVE